MAVEVHLPEFAETVTDAKLAAWLKQEGDTVVAGEPIAEIETEKTTVELEAPVSGVLQKICVVEGTEALEPGGVLALIDESDAGMSSGPVVSSSVMEPASEDDDADTVTLDTTQVEVPSPTGAETVSATPLARRMAAVTGLNLAEIEGTGPGGRIRKGDVDRARGARVEAEEAYEDQSLSAMRRVTAVRMADAKRTVPHFYLRVECVADALVDLRARLNAERSDRALTLTDLIVRAAGLALRKFPQANASWTENAVRVYRAIDIAVAVNTPAGLIAPIVRQVDRKSLDVISLELRALTVRARDGKLQPEEYTGGTFTVSNLGMFGVESLYAIVNPPQSAILGVGAARQRPVVRDGEVMVGTSLTCTLSADHRTIDGVIGAEFLAEIQRLIETPALLSAATPGSR